MSRFIIVTTSYGSYPFPPASFIASPTSCVPWPVSSARSGGLRDFMPVLRNRESGRIYKFARTVSSNAKAHELRGQKLYVSAALSNPLTAEASAPCSGQFKEKNSVFRRSPANSSLVPSIFQRNWKCRTKLHRQFARQDRGLRSCHVGNVGNAFLGLASGAYAEIRDPL